MASAGSADVLSDPRTWSLVVGGISLAIVWTCETPSNLWEARKKIGALASRVRHAMFETDTSHDGTSYAARYSHAEACGSDHLAPGLCITAGGMVVSHLDWIEGSKHRSAPRPAFLRYPMSSADCSYGVVGPLQCELIGLVGFLLSGVLVFNLRRVGISRFVLRTQYASSGADIDRNQAIGRFYTFDHR